MALIDIIINHVKAVLMGSRKTAPKIVLSTDERVIAAATWVEIQREQYAKNSRGVGRWPPRKDKLPHPILIKTGQLYGAINIRNIRYNANGFDFVWPRTIHRDIVGGSWRKGYVLGRSKKRPKKGKGSRGITIARLASIHSEGLGRVPKRLIIWPLTQAQQNVVLKRMRNAR